MQVIPIQPIPNQTLQVQLDQQACTLSIFQYVFGLFISVYVSDELIIASVPCENFNRIVRSDYLGFSGDLAFLDTQGTDDPIYTGLGSRFVLLYLSASELAVEG